MLALVDPPQPRPASRSERNTRAMVRATMRLRRLFPSLDVQGGLHDYAHIARFDFVAQRKTEAAAYAIDNWAEELADHGDLATHEIGKRILRAAYPRGWATP